MYWLVLGIISIVMAFAFQMIFRSRFEDVKNNYWMLLAVSVIGAWVGDLVLGDWLLMISGYNVIAGISGSLVLGLLYTLFYANRRHPRGAAKA